MSRIEHDPVVFATNQYLDSLETVEPWPECKFCGAEHDTRNEDCDLETYEAFQHLKMGVSLEQ